MNIYAPKLSSGKRDTVARMNEWLTNILAELEEQAKQITELNAVLANAETRRAKFAKDAALDG